ncbi:hypothetical protein MNV49_002162 [Pseudohyphozyma bogoriensis]|nr:hypothetical protein MNV49_002162 [Pseudohyphozyma bogoriensis]
MALSEESKERILRATELAKTAVHVLWIPTILYFAWDRAGALRKKDARVAHKAAHPSGAIGSPWAVIGGKDADINGAQIKWENLCVALGTGGEPDGGKTGRQLHRLNRTRMLTLSALALLLSPRPGLMK